MTHESITQTVIGTSIEIINELGSGFLESIYRKILHSLLETKGLNVTIQAPIQVYFRNRPVGDFFADLLIEDLVLVELKCVKVLAPEHSAQLINYLCATRKETGLLINFGNPHLEFKRLTRSFQKLPSSASCPSMPNPPRFKKEEIY